jgi:hypothetical protein
MWLTAGPKAAIATCLTMKVLFATAARGAAAIMPPRKNAKPGKPGTAGAIAGSEALRASRRVGGTI